MAKCQHCSLTEQPTAAKRDAVVEEVVVESALERLSNGLNETRELLAEQALEPDRERSNWRDCADEVDAVVEVFETEVLDLIDGVTGELDDDQRAGLLATVQTDGASVAAVLHASGHATDAIALLSRLRRLTYDESSASLRAAEVDIEAYTRLDHAGWALASGDRRRAEQLARDLLATRPHELIAEGAQAIVDAPRPIAKAPELFSWNGFGVGMYGARDHRGDTHVSTHCITAAWVPIIPLSAYRVTDHGDSMYTFYAREKLSSFAVWARRGVALAVLLVVGGLWANSYFNSSTRKAERAMDKAASVAKAGDIDAAIERYERVIADYGTRVDRDVVGRAATALAALYATAAPTPFGVDDVQLGTRVVRRFEALPASARTRDATGAMVDIVVGWADELGTEDSGAILAASSLLEAVVPIATDANIRGPVDKRNELRGALAEEIAGAWPLAALELYLDLGTDEAIAASADIATRLAAHPSLLRASPVLIGTWLQRADDVTDAHAARDALSGAFAAASAEADDETRAALMAGRDEAALRAHLADHPNDQEIATTLAGLLLSTGKANEARVLLETLGLPGWLTPDAQQVLAAAYADAGSLDAADDLLSDVLQFRLPRFIAASHAYTSAARAKEEALIRRAELGQLPTALLNQLDNASEEHARELWSKWLGEQLDSDPKLAELRKEYVAHSDVVSTSVSLGSIKLRRALATTGDDRTRLLEEAERAFLAIRQDAEGMPQFHLGLGQVYYRLGREDDGETEFASVLAHGDPELDMLAARAYRDLGNVARAREVAERVYNTGTKPFNDNAAVLLGLTATTNDDAEMWLSRADQSLPFVKTSLLEVKARRLLDDGQSAEAARVMGEAAAFHERTATTSAASANNAAVAYSFIYSCTGDIRTLDKALASFDAAVKLDPQSALTIGNAADAHFRAGAIEVLDAWVDAKALRLSGGATSALESMLQGSMRDELLAALAANASITRAIALTQQEMALAPNRARPIERTLQWYGWLRDTDKLALLREQLMSRNVSVDDTSTNEARAAYASGEDDADNIALLNQSAARSREAIARVGRDKKSIAVGQLLLAEVLYRKATLTLATEDAQAAVDAMRAARTAWPEIDSGRDLSRELVLLAALSVPAATDALRADARLYSVPTALYRHRDDDGLVESLRAHPAFAEALALRKAVASAEPSLNDWLVGTLAGDAELRASGASYFTDEAEQLELAIERRIDPSSPYLILVGEINAANGG